MNKLMNQITIALIMIAFATSQQVADAELKASLGSAALKPLEAQLNPTLRTAELKTDLLAKPLSDDLIAKPLLAAQLALKNNDLRAFVANQNAYELKSWSAALSPDLKYDDASLRALLGAQADETDPNIASAAEVPAETGRLLAALPNSYDLRSAYPGCWSIRYIRNQGQCGSCWAVAGATSMSDRSCINKPFLWFLVSVQKKRSFSYQDPLECCSHATCGTGHRKGCNGGKISGAFAFAQQTGIVTGENYGNTTNCKNYFLAPHHAAAAAPACRAFCPTAGYGVSYNNDKRKILAYKVYTKAALGVAGVVSATKNAIFNRGTVTAYLDVYSDFFAYSQGVYVKTQGAVFKGGHAVRLIGWGANQIISTIFFKIELGPYWIGANSWGTGWGNGGFFYIRRGSNEVNIEHYVVEALL
jgi:cathepsin B